MHKIVINKCFGGFSLSEEAIDWIKAHEPDFFERYDIDIPRHNKLLVQCVETLGSKASGRFSELTIVKIEGNLYRIDEYDGLESVETPNTINFIKIDSDE